MKVSRSAVPTQLGASQTSTPPHTTAAFPLGILRRAPPEGPPRVQRWRRKAVGLSVCFIKHGTHPLAKLLERAGNKPRPRKPMTLVVRYVLLGNSAMSSSQRGSTISGFFGSAGRRSSPGRQKRVIRRGGRRHVGSKRKGLQATALARRQAHPSSCPAGWRPSCAAAAESRESCPWRSEV